MPIIGTLPVVFMVSGRRDIPYQGIYRRYTVSGGGIPVGWFVNPLVFQPTNQPEL
jgi:hypothetical protein